MTLDRGILELVEGVSIIALLLPDKELCSFVSRQNLRSAELDLPASDLGPVVGVVQKVVGYNPERNIEINVKTSGGT